MKESKKTYSDGTELKRHHVEIIKSHDMVKWHKLNKTVYSYVTEYSHVMEAITDHIRVQHGTEQNVATSASGRME